MLNAHNQAVLAHAQYLANLGYIPLLIHGVSFVRREDGRYHPLCTCFVKEGCQTIGKHPVRGWNQSPMATPSEGLGLLRELLQKARPDQNFNLGVRTGSISGCFAIDIDAKGNGFANFKEFLGSRKIDSEVHYQTLTAKTGGGGRHYVYTYPKSAEKIPSVANHHAFNFKLNPRDPDESSIDVRGDGGYIVVWPSFHKSGGQYSWENDPETSRKEAPVEIIRAVEKQRRNNTDTNATYTPDIDELKALADRFIRNKKEDTAHIGRLLSEILDGKPIKIEGGAHDAFKMVSYRVAIEYPRADPIDLAEFFRSSIDARAELRPDGSCTFEDVFKCVESALRKRREEESHWENQMIVSEKGKPVTCTKNVLSVLKNAPEWDGIFALDARSQRPMVLRPLPGLVLGDNTDNVYPRSLLDADQIHVVTRMTARFQGNVRRDHVNEAIDLLCKERAIDIFLEYLKSLPRWDGRPRVDFWLISLGGAEDSLYTRAVSSKFLLQMAKRTLEPGCQADGVLILEGEQGIGKSSLLRAIVPHSSLFCDDLSIISGHQNKDNLLKLHGPALIELAELSAMHKSDVEPVKAFLTTRIDQFRLPYDTQVKNVPRRCVFAGTTNATEYLRDASGNRRFWPVLLTRQVDIPLAIAHRDQLWAEVLYRLAANEQVFLTKELEEIAKDVQKSRTEDELWHEKIENWLLERDRALAKAQLAAKERAANAAPGPISASGNIGNTEIADEDDLATFFWLKKYDGIDFWDRALREKYGEIDHFTNEHVYRMLFDDGESPDRRNSALARSISNTLKALGYVQKRVGKTKKRVWCRAE